MSTYSYSEFWSVFLGKILHLMILIEITNNTYTYNNQIPNSH